MAHDPNTQASPCRQFFAQTFHAPGQRLAKVFHYVDGIVPVSDTDDGAGEALAFLRDYAVQYSKLGDEIRPLPLAGDTANQIAQNDISEAIASLRSLARVACALAYHFPETPAVSRMATIATNSIETARLAFVTIGDVSKPQNHQ